MSTETLDPAQIMAGHEAHWRTTNGTPLCMGGRECAGEDPKRCMIYELAEALAAERARVQRVEAARALIGEPRVWVIDGPDIGRMKVLGMLDRALAGDTEAKP